MSKTPSAKKTGLMQRLAAAWIREIGLHGFIGHPETLFEHPEVVKRVNRLCPATLGIIAWKGMERGKQGGNTSLYDVHNGTYLSKHAGGKQLLRALAQTAIVAEMFDQLGQPYEDWRNPGMLVSERLAEEEFDRGMRDYVHHGSAAPTRQ